MSWHVGVTLAAKLAVNHCFLQKKSRLQRTLRNSGPLGRLPQFLIPPKESLPNSPANSLKAIPKAPYLTVCVLECAPLEFGKALLYLSGQLYCTGTIPVHGSEVLQDQQPRVLALIQPQLMFIPSNSSHTLYCNSSRTLYPLIESNLKSNLWPQECAEFYIVGFLCSHRALVRSVAAHRQTRACLITVSCETRLRSQ